MEERHRRPSPMGTIWSLVLSCGKLGRDTSHGSVQSLLARGLFQEEPRSFSWAVLYISWFGGTMLSRAVNPFPPFASVAAGAAEKEWATPAPCTFIGLCFDLIRLSMEGVQPLSLPSLCHPFVLRNQLGWLLNPASSCNLALFGGVLEITELLLLWKFTVWIPEHPSVAS